MKVLIIANYVSFPWELGNCRFIYLANLLTENNEVELITSDFYHTNKKTRNSKDENYDSLGFKVSLIKEPGYSKNVSIRRLISHKILANNLKEYLKRIKYKPDVIYCAVPSLDVAKEATKYANKKRIKLIIDIQDLWPEAFEMVINIPIISNILFYPMRKKADYIYSRADEIVGVSETYVDRALKVNKKVRGGLSVYLGTDLKNFDIYSKRNNYKYNDDVIRVVYIGTLGTSYDLKTIIRSIRLINEKGINNIEFIVIGDGPLKHEFEEYAAENKISYSFMGRMPYDKMVELLCSCDICVNPIIGKSVASIINKVGDYAAAGLPVINTQNSEEYRSIISEYKAGYNCNCSDSYDVANKIEKLIKNEKLRKTMGKNNRRLAENKFDRKKNYKRIVDLIVGRD